MSSIRVLIVDDEEELASVIAERLQFRGMEAQTALEGRKALKIIEENPPNIVLLDLMLPGLGGLEILKRIKQMNYNLPVILLTGYGSKETAKEGMSLGAFDYVMKPCDIDSLIAKIQEAASSKP
jgi:DNA-binding response OmpR family regulator